MKLARINKLDALLVMYDVNYFFGGGFVRFDETIFNFERP